ncbi:MAG: hypothetical protein R3C14_14110 [Caldilineaceae bacterium]
MMATVQTLTQRFEKVFEPRQAVVLAESITEAYEDLVKTSDFNELKAIVKDLAQAQQRTEARVDDLVQAQQRTEARVDDLAKDMQELTRVVTEMGRQMTVMGRQMGDMRSEIGGMSRSMAYALENDAYRSLPAYLQAHHDIMLTERIVRTDVAGEEINIFALGEHNGEPICLVGESKLQLDERRASKHEAERVAQQLKRKADAVRELYPEREIVRLLVTHYARPVIRKLLEEQQIIVVQTFEW